MRWICKVVSLFLKVPEQLPPKRLLDQLKRLGPRSAGDLGRVLGITKMAVLQQLHDLEEQGLVQRAAQRGRRGRPTLLWSLTTAARRFFPDAHAELAVSLIDCLKEGLGEEALAEVIQTRSRHQIQRYRTEMASAGTLAKRLKVLAAARTREGYMAEVQPTTLGYLFIEKHCPICVAATACTGFCSEELDVFRRVLGRDVRIERAEHLLAGSHRCAYTVRSTRDSK
jgi:predicted ArsR family transcriptional regulator